MKMIRKYAIRTGYSVINGERTNTFDCPNRKCEREVLEDYTCCPWCGQKLKFQTAAENFLDSLNDNSYKMAISDIDDMYEMLLGESELQALNVIYKQGKYDC